MQKIKKTVPSQPVETKPKKLQRMSSFNRPSIESNGDMYDLIETAKKALKKAGFKEHAKEMEDRCLESGDYDEIINILIEYVIVD